MPSSVSALRYGRRLLRRMSMYTSLLTVPSMNAIGPNLLLTKHPHIICETSPSLALPRTFLSAYFSCLFWCRKTQNLLSSEILLNCRLVRPRNPGPIFPCFVLMHHCPLKTLCSMFFSQQRSLDSSPFPYQIVVKPSPNCCCRNWYIDNVL